MIGLVDGNNFFVSCERVFNPKLEGRPVAVLSNNDGCVVSRSNEFKALKIPMGTPYFQLKPYIEPYGLILLSSNYELYADMSRRVIDLLGDFSTDVEQYSIDEAFIHLNMPSQPDFSAYGQTVRKRILQWLGLPVGVGFAETKTLAKIANHLGKKRADGVFVMPGRAEERRAVLASVPVDDVWGVGRRLAPRLMRRGIRTALNLAETDPVDMREEYGVPLMRTILELRGTPAVPAEDPDALSQSISCSRCFGQPVMLYEEIAESVAHYTATAAEKLRKEQQKAAGVNVYLQYYPEYEPVKKEGGLTAATVVFPSPTDDTRDMLKSISGRLPRIYIKGRRYKKSGIVFFGLEQRDNPQLELFPAQEKPGQRQLLSTIDQLNRKFGRGAVFSLAEGTKREWAMKRQFKSKAFTTNWNQLLEVT